MLKWLERLLARIARWFRTGTSNGQAATAQHASRYNVLIVDPEAQVAAGFASSLDLGPHVRWAGDAKTAIQMALEEPPNCVLVSLELPAEAASDVARSLRNICGRGVMIVALGDEAQDDQLEHFDFRMARPTQASRWRDLVMLATPRRSSRLG